MAVSLKLGGVPAPAAAPSSPTPTAKPLGAVFDKHIPPNPLAAPQQFQSKPAVATISVEEKTGKEVIGETMTQEELHPGVLSSEPLCEVYVEGSRTVNLGNFESTRIAIGVRMPCKKAELGGTYTEAVGWINDRLVAMVGEVKKAS